MFRSKAAREGAKRKKRRWGRRILFVFLLGVIAVAAVMLLSPAPFIQMVATRVLAAQGLTPVSMRVERADWRVFIAHDLVLGSGPDLSIGELRLEYALGELVRGRIRNVTLDDVRVLARVLDDQAAPEERRILSFGVLDHLISNIVFGADSYDGPFPALTLNNGLFRIETPLGPLNMTFGVTQTRKNDIDAFVRLQEEDAATEGFEVTRLEGEWRQSASGEQEARFSFVLGRLATEGVEIRNAQFDVNYAGNGIDAMGALDVHMPVIAISKERSQTSRNVLSTDVRDALNAPMAAPFTDKLGSAFGNMLQNAALNGRLLIVRDEQGFTFSFDQPLVLEGAPLEEQNARPSSNQTQSPDEGQPALRVLVGNADDEQPFLAFHEQGERRLNFFSGVTVEGGGLPELNVQFLGQVGAPSPALGGKTPGAAPLPRNNPVLARVMIDLAPWSEGGFTIGAAGLDLSIEGHPDKFSGRIVGEILLDGSPVAGLSLGNGRLGLAGDFQRDQSGFFYAQATDSCMVLESEEIEVTGVQFERPILSMCANEGEPLLHVLFGEGRPMEIQLNFTLPSEETRIALDAGMDVRGSFPQVDIYTEYITSTQQWRLTYGVYGGSLALNSDAALLKELKLSGIASGEAEKLEEFNATLDQVVLSDGVEFPRFAPIRVVGQLRLNGGEAVYEALATDQGGRAMAEFEGRHDRQSKEGRLAGATPPLAFAPTGFQPQDWLPALKGVVAEVEGTASAEMLVQWGEGYLDSSAGVRLTEIKMATSIGPMVGINSEIALSSLLPPATQKPQIIHIREIDIGTDLLFGMLSFSVSPDGSIFIENAEWPWAGGLIGLERTELFFDDRAQELVLTAQGVDLKEVFTLLDVDGLEGTGILGGKLPVSITEGSIEVINGKLVSAPEGGTLHYNGSASQAASTAEGSALLFNALQDFHYDKLEVSINGRTTDVLTVSIALNGYNPNVMNGYPIKLNINTEGPLVEMLRQGTIGYRIPSQIRERLNQNAR